MNELHSRNIFIASTLQQRLDRLRVQPSRDMLSKYFQTVLSSHQFIAPESTDSSTIPYNEKNERRMIDEFINRSSVFHEKLRRHLTSMDREIESNKGLLLRYHEERSEKELFLRDLENDTNCRYQELERKIKQVNKWRILYEKVHKELVNKQDTFTPENLKDSGSNLDGMRRNITKLLGDNKDLTNQLQFMNKQLRLFEVKLKAVRIEIESRKASISPNAVGDSADPPLLGFEESKKPLCEIDDESLEARIFRESVEKPCNGLNACNSYISMMNDIHIPASEISIHRSRLLDLFGKEFYANWKRAQVMFSLAEALQYMATLRDLNMAVQFVMTAICKLCECDRASYWVIDKTRGIAWTRVQSFTPPGKDDREDVVKKPSARRNSAIESDDDTSVVEKTRDPLNVVSLDNSSNNRQMTTLMIPVNTGLVGSAFNTGQVINIPDAYADPRFNRMVDQKTEYRTRSVLCFPIVYQGQVLGVTQCINKISPSSDCFSSDDIDIVKTLGGAMVSVLSCCHSHEENKKLQVRRSVLVETVDEMTRRMSSRKEMILIMKEKMQKMFKANDCGIILVYSDFFAKIVIEFDGTVGLVCSDKGSHSLVGSCVRNRAPLHVFGKLELAKYNLGKSDLDIIKTTNQVSSPLQQGDVSVHSWPLFSPTRSGEISAVIQWVCLDRSLIAFGDDGSFNESNPIHVDLITRFMKQVSFYVDRYWPSQYRLGWNKAKHLQLKVRGMISFSSAKKSLDLIGPRIRDSKIASAPPPSNRQIIELWKRAKELAATAVKSGNSSPRGGIVGRPSMLASNSRMNDFGEKMKKERQSMIKRKTVVVNQSSMEELLAISVSPVNKFEFKTIAPNGDGPDGPIDTESSSSEHA
jgi:hypothetical protein